jgi:hypothetical protein
MMVVRVTATSKLVKLIRRVRTLAAMIDEIAIVSAFLFVIFPDGKGLLGRSFLSISISK